ncbi:MAG: TerC/Alx family metal homeostasis membrane protein [Verrucomicrobia bacterium]|nr:TerC/Alx family metal homeostasis membrane protein [Verrucomicrobiota bacterium]
MARWIGFHILVLILLAIDLSVSRKREMKTKTALIWSIGWIALALIFNGFIYVQAGSEKGIEFFTAYLLEKSLSIDNLFVFLLIFSFFKVPKELQHKVLYFGVLGAFVMRLVLILGGVALIHQFQWVTYVLGLVVGFTGIRLISQKKKELPLEENRLLQWIRRRFKVTTDYVEDKFFVWRAGVRYLTPLFLVLVMVETSDLLFALDSIPAVLAVTKHPFIAYTSNVFAVLGLRSLFFLIAPWFELLSHLKIGLGAILIFIGLKMLLAPLFTIPLMISLAVIATILLISVLYSILKK